MHPITLLLSLALAWRSNAFLTESDRRATVLHSSSAADDAWKGEIVAGGTIPGCTIVSVGLTEYEVSVDGVAADLGGFSEAVHRKIMKDAKQQRFQGFRPGTIPPHLEVTYKAFTMDEVARETVLEALQQKNIRPFEQARAEIVITDIAVPPPRPKSKGKKKAKGAIEEVNQLENTEWKTYDSMKEAIQVGRWTPGSSFSFTATNVKGQEVLPSNGN